MQSIPKPYLLFLGDVTDPLAVKTARGIHHWRPEACIGQLRLSADAISLGLTEMDVLTAKQQGAKTLVLGTANAGGKLPAHWLASIKAAIRAGLNVANGLHQGLKDIPELVELAKQHQVELFDVRHMQPTLDTGTGKRRSGKRILTVGTDCSVGKMFSSLALEAALRQLDIQADFRATGQTGILVAGAGIAIDAVIADFISGAVEALAPANEENHWDIIEGQGSLFHPSFAGVSMGLIHGAQADLLVMCHELGRPHMRHLPHMPLPSLRQCVEANLLAARLTSPDVRLAGFSLNTSAVDEPRANAALVEISAEFGVPATDPVRFGMQDLARWVQERG
jgi:uncharacterized NAD-dependent epimerase/dehydratase family protein